MVSNVAPTQIGDAVRLWGHLFDHQPHLLSLFTGYLSPAKRRLEMTATRFYAEHQWSDALAWAEQQDEINRECYFCAHQLVAPERVKGNAAPVTCLWADLDGADIAQSPFDPTAIVESSPGRMHVYARLNRPVEPALAEQLNRRWAKAFAADPSGWDLSQVLRIPGTHNGKYDGRPLVHLLELDERTRFDPDELDALLPPLPAKQPAPSLPLDAVTTIAAAGEPPVRLFGPALRRWNGAEAAFSRSDRSGRLCEIARDLLFANASRAITFAAVEQRDQTLDILGKFSERDDRAVRYQEVVDWAWAQLVRADDRGGLVDDDTSPAEVTRSAAVTVRAAPVRGSAGFVFTHLSALLAEPEQTTEYLVADLLPLGGVSMIAAKPKVGKSTTARNLAWSVASGSSFLGRATQTGPVLYLALEEKRAEVAAHFRRMGATCEPILIHVGAAPASSAQGIAELAAAIAEYHALLAIADPALRLVRVRDASDYAEMITALEPVIELARGTGCHICVPHHAGKMDRGGGDSVLGSTALFGSVDTLIEMRRREYGRTLLSIQRYGPDMDEVVIPLDDQTGLIGLGGDIETMRLDKARAAIAQVVAGHDVGLAESSVKDSVEGASEVTGKALRSMVLDGTLERLGAGKRGDPYRYRLASAEDGE